jgi:hypothetical protein
MPSLNMNQPSQLVEMPKPATRLQGFLQLGQLPHVAASLSPSISPPKDTQALVDYCEAEEGAALQLPPHLSVS